MDDLRFLYFYKVTKSMIKIAAKILPSRQEKFHLKHYKLNSNEPAQCPDERKVEQHCAYPS